VRPDADVLRTALENPGGAGISVQDARGRLHAATTARAKARFSLPIEEWETVTQQIAGTDLALREALGEIVLSPETSRRLLPFLQGNSELTSFIRSSTEQDWCVFQQTEADDDPWALIKHGGGNE